MRSPTRLRLCRRPAACELCAGCVQDAPAIPAMPRPPCESSAAGSSYTWLLMVAVPASAPASNATRSSCRQQGQPFGARCTSSDHPLIMHLGGHGSFSHKQRPAQVWSGVSALSRAPRSHPSAKAADLQGCHVSRRSARGGGHLQAAQPLVQGPHAGPHELRKPPDPAPSVPSHARPVHGRHLVSLLICNLNLTGSILMICIHLHTGEVLADTLACAAGRAGLTR